MTRWLAILIRVFAAGPFLVMGALLLSVAQIIAAGAAWIEGERPFGSRP